MKIDRKCIKIPISDKTISNTILSRDENHKLLVIAGYENMSVGRYVAKLIKADIERKGFLFN